MGRVGMHHGVRPRPFLRKRGGEAGHKSLLLLFFRKEGLSFFVGWQWGFEGEVGETGQRWRVLPALRRGIVAVDAVVDYSVDFGLLFGGVGGTVGVGADQVVGHLVEGTFEA